MKKHWLYVALFPVLVAAPLLQGCEVNTANVVSGTASVLTFFAREDVNLLQKSYAAADYLEPQIKSYVSMRDAIRVVALSDVEAPDIYAPIAGLIPQQVGQRLAQLGYTVDLSEVANEAERKHIKGPQNPEYILSGLYKKNRQDMDVTLRVTGAQSGNLVASFSYVLPYDREIRKLNAPQAQIMRTTAE